MAYHVDNLSLSIDHASSSSCLSHLFRSRTIRTIASLQGSLSYLSSGSHAAVTATVWVGSTHWVLDRKKAEKVNQTESKSDKLKIDLI